jgi:hypothetical protein
MFTFIFSSNKKVNINYSIFKYFDCEFIRTWLHLIKKREVDEY